MRHTRTHGGQKVALGLALVLSLALPMPAQAASGKPTAPTPAPVSAVGEKSSDAAVAEVAPSGDEAFSPDVLTASTSLTARDLAREKGQRVEALDLRTTTTSTYALPDGSWQVAQSGAPRWAQTSGDGTRAADWQNVDPRLAPNGDGSYSPNVHPQDIVVNGGGGEFFRLSDPATGASVALALSSGTVPTPTIDGPRATFSNIAEGTDLLVEVRPVGYEYYLILRTPAAARRASAVPLVLSIKGATMRPDDAGGFQIVGSTGAVLGSMPPAIAWDAQSDLKSGSPVLDAWSPEQEFAPVTRALDHLSLSDRVKAAREFLAGGDDLQSQRFKDVVEKYVPGHAAGTFSVALEVPQGWADSSATHYPLVLDPGWNWGVNFDTWVDNGYTSDQSGSTELRIGARDSTHKARTYINASFPAIQYAAISDANLHLWEWNSWSCSPRGWYVQRAGLASTGTRWTAQPGLLTMGGSTTATVGFSSSCQDNWVSVPVTNLAQEWAAYPDGTNHGLLVRASSETDTYGHKKFNSNEMGWGAPYFDFTFTTVAPKVPTDITVGDLPLTARNVTQFSDKRPVFRARVTDADNPPGVRNLHAVFVLYKDGVEVPPSYDGTTVASGGFSTYTPTFDLEEGANYSLYVATVFDDWTVSAGVGGGGKFTTISQQPAAASGLKLNSLLVPSGTAQADGSATGISTPLAFTGLKDVIEVGDANSDGKPDLLAWTVAGTLGLYLGDGAGGVQSATPIPVAGNWAAYAQIVGPGDWTGDGKVDLISMDAAGYLYVNVGDGTGAFAASSTAIGSGWAGARGILTPGDLNKDGNNDIVLLTTAGLLLLYPGNGAGGWGSGLAAQIGSGWQGFSLVLTPGDFNHDSYGAPDLLGVGSPTDSLRLYYGVGTGGGLSGGSIISSAWGGFSLSFAPGDFNGNTTSDLLGVTADATLTLFDGNGTGGISTIGTVVGVAAAPGATLAPRVLADSTPALSAVVSDPDGGQVRAVFSLYRKRAGETAWELVRNDLYGSWVTSGQRSYFRGTALSNDPGLEAALVAGNEYRIEVRSQDKSQSSASALTTGVLTVAPPSAAPDIPAGCDTTSGTPSGSSTTC